MSDLGAAALGALGGFVVGRSAASDRGSNGCNGSAEGDSIPSDSDQVDVEALRAAAELGTAVMLELGTLDPDEALASVRRTAQLTQWEATANAYGIASPSELASRLTEAPVDYVPVTVPSSGQPLSSVQCPGYFQRTGDRTISSMSRTLKTPAGVYFMKGVRSSWGGAKDERSPVLQPLTSMALNALTFVGRTFRLVLPATPGDGYSTALLLRGKVQTVSGKTLGLGDMLAHGQWYGAYNADQSGELHTYSVRTPTTGKFFKAYPVVRVIASDTISLCAVLHSDGTSKPGKADYTGFVFIASAADYVPYRFALLGASLESNTVAAPRSASGQVHFAKWMLDDYGKDVTVAGGSGSCSLKYSTQCAPAKPQGSVSYMCALPASAS